MALQCDYTFKTILIPNAYIRIDRVSGSKREGKLVPQMTGNALWLANVEVLASDMETRIANHTYVLPLADFNINVFQHFYEHLKSLPEFSGAVDC